MFLDGILTCPHVDSSGEILSIEGVDITDFQSGKALINWEHDNSKAENIIGIVVYCKKIFKKSDCENERQKMFFDMAKGPYIYLIGELFDEQNHPGAVACAAMVRYYQKRKEKFLMGWSIEGLTLEREGHHLKRSVARKVAFTMKSCLKSAVMGAPELDDVKELGVIVKNENLYEMNYDAVELDSSEYSTVVIKSEVQYALDELKKTLSAGMPSGAPDTRVGGAALQIEDVTSSRKNKIKAAIRDWDRTRPLKEVIKAKLPEVSDDYVDHFVELAGDLMLKKGISPEVHRISKEHAAAPAGSDNSLLEGLYFSPETHGAPEFKSHGFVNDQGQKVALMPLRSPEDGRKSLMYHRLARDVMGATENIPQTSILKHPKMEQHMMAQEMPEGRLLSTMNTLGGKMAEKYPEEAHKMFLLDFILGNTGAKSHDHLITQDGKIKSVGKQKPLQYQPVEINGLNFPYLDANGNDLSTTHMDESARQWLNGIDYKKLARAMAEHGAEKLDIIHAVRRLRLAQKAADHMQSPKDIATHDSQSFQVKDNETSDL